MPVPPRVAMIAPVVTLATGTVATEKVPVSWPAGIRRVCGTEAAPFPFARVIVRSAGEVISRVTVPVEPLPPVTPAGTSTTD